MKEVRGRRVTNTANLSKKLALGGAGVSDVFAVSVVPAALAGTLPESVDSVVLAVSVGFASSDVASLSL